MHVSNNIYMTSLHLGVSPFIYIGGGCFLLMIIPTATIGLRLDVSSYPAYCTVYLLLPSLLQLSCFFQMLLIDTMLAA